jgi:glycosyltransferase involved in cell wall biosynthesis
LDSVPKPKVTFDIQTYRTTADGQAAAATDLPYDDVVHIHPEALSESEYESFIEDADIILLPYLRGPYQAQTSGIYCEAAALGIPVVVSEGTWVADQIAKSGGGVLFEGGDAVSLANACLEAIRNHPRLLRMAEQAAPTWRAFHNAPNYVAHLEALLEGVPAAHAA